MRLSHALLVTTVLGVTVTRPALGQEAHDHHAHHGAGHGEAPQDLVLPDHLRQKLVLEMQAISGGMGALLNHLVRGEGDQAVRIADQIRDTFLLEQELSGEELAELSSLLPEGFIKKDRSFHDTAKKLSTAADSADFASAIQHYATMTRACVSCHASYATDRFPSLAGSREQEDGADVETKQ